MSIHAPMPPAPLTGLCPRETRTFEAVTRAVVWCAGGAWTLTRELLSSGGRATFVVWNAPQRMHDVLILWSSAGQRLLIGRSIGGRWFITAAPSDLKDPDWQCAGNDVAVAWIHSADSALSGLHRTLQRQDLHGLRATFAAPSEFDAVGRTLRLLLALADDTNLQDSLNHLSAPSPCLWAWLAPSQSRERRMRALALEPAALWKALQVVGKACEAAEAEMDLAVRLLVAADRRDPLRPLAMALTGLSREQIRWANRVLAETSLSDADRRDTLTTLPHVKPAHRPRSEGQLRGLLPWIRADASDWRLLFTGCAAAGLSPSALETSARTFLAHCERPFVPAPPPLPDDVAEWISGLPTLALRAQAHAAVAGLTPRKRGDAAVRLRARIGMPWEESPDGCAARERVATTVWRHAGLSESSRDGPSSAPVPWDRTGSAPVVPGFTFLFPRTADALAGVGHRMLNCLRARALNFQTEILRGQKLLILIEQHGHPAQDATLASLDLELDEERVAATVDQHYGQGNTPVPRAHALALALLRRSIRRWFACPDNHQRWKRCADAIDRKMSRLSVEAAGRDLLWRQQLCSQLLLPAVLDANGPTSDPAGTTFWRSRHPA